jgi:hypothetical protein
MVDSGNVEDIGSAETEGLNQNHAFLVPRPGIEGLQIDAVGNHLNPRFGNPKDFHQFLFYPGAHGDDSI